jgi:hypothetical protein
MDQRVRGVRRDMQAYHGNGWYVVPRKGFPTAHNCMMCRRKPRDGQIVWAYREICKVLANLEQPVHLGHVYVVHRDCMAAAVESAPLDNYETIRDRIATGGPLFDG